MTDRQYEIIRAIVKEYLITGEPVGSQILVQRFNLEFSPATVRKEMSVLEQMGLLVSPHTSAGRVPTDRAFQIYLAELVNLFEITLNQKVELEELYRSAKLQLDQLLKTTAQMLAMTSNYAGIVLAPGSTGSTIRRVELISVLENLVLMVMVSQSGTVYEKKIKLEKSVSQEDLYKISRFLNQYLKGYEITELQSKGLEFMSESLSGLQELADIALTVSQALVYNPPDQIVYVEGESNLYRQILEQIPERKEAERIIRKFEDKNYMAELLNRMKNFPRVGAQIGLDIDGEKIEGIALLGKGYSVGGRNVGALGVIGPNRMPYEKLIPALDYSAQILTNVLNEKTDIPTGEISPREIETITRKSLQTSGGTIPEKKSPELNQNRKRGNK